MLTFQLCQFSSSFSFELIVGVVLFWLFGSYSFLVAIAKRSQLSITSLCLLAAIFDSSSTQYNKVALILSIFAQSSLLTNVNKFELKCPAYFYYAGHLSSNKNKKFTCWHSGAKSTSWIIFFYFCLNSSAQHSKTMLGTTKLCRVAIKDCYRVATRSSRSTNVDRSKIATKR